MNYTEKLEEFCYNMCTKIIEQDGDSWAGRIVEFPGCFVLVDREDQVEEVLKNVAIAWLRGHLNGIKKII